MPITQTPRRIPNSQILDPPSGLNSDCEAGAQGFALAAAALRPVSPGLREVMQAAVIHDGPIFLN